MLGYILKSYPIKHREDFFSFSLLKEQFQYAFPFGIAVILSTTCNQIDKLICVNYLSIEEYAVYSIAFFGIPGVMQIYDALCQVNIMNMATEYKNGTIEQVKNLYQRFVVQTLSFSLPVIGVVCLFSPQIIHFLFSEKYLATEEDFDLLMKDTKNKLMEISKGIIEGEIGIHPYRKEDDSTSCDYCPYHAVCRFDPRLGNTYRKLQEMTDDQVYDALRKKYGEQGEE